MVLRVIMVNYMVTVADCQWLEKNWQARIRQTRPFPDGFDVVNNLITHSTADRAGNQGADRVRRQ